MHRRRLRYALQQEKRKFRLFTAILIVCVLFLTLFGLKILIGASVLVERVKGDPQDQNSVTSDVLLPPSLDETLSATNSGTFVLTGIGRAGSALHIFRNGSQVWNQDLSEDQFTAEVPLEKNENELKAKTVLPNGNESEFSNTISIYYSTTGPDLELLTPKDGDTVRGESSKTEVRGTVPDNTRVTVNSRIARIEPDGSFSVDITLNDGENSIEVIAKDEAGNTTEKSITVRYEK